MFLRTKTVKRSEKTYEYLQIVESYRDTDGVTRQRVLKNLGSRSNPDLGQLDTLIAALVRVRREAAPTPTDGTST